MADITMCDNKDCNLKETCYRFKATPSKIMQYYFFGKVNHDNDNCDYYWRLKEIDTKDLKRKKN